MGAAAPDGYALNQLGTFSTAVCIVIDKLSVGADTMHGGGMLMPTMWARDGLHVDVERTPDGGFEIAGQDLRDDNMFGADEYEYWLTVSAGRPRSRLGQVDELAEEGAGGGGVEAVAP